MTSQRNNHLDVETAMAEVRSAYDTLNEVLEALATPEELASGSCCRRDHAVKRIEALKKKAGNLDVLVEATGTASVAHATSKLRASAKESDLPPAFQVPKPIWLDQAKSAASAKTANRRANKQVLEAINCVVEQTPDEDVEAMRKFLFAALVSERDKATSASGFEEKALKLHTMAINEGIAKFLTNCAAYTLSQPPEND